MAAAWVIALAAGVALIVWGAEAFAEHLSAAATRMGVAVFALALLLAGAEPEELATVVAASARDAPAIAFGDIIGSNIAMCLVALGAGAILVPLHFRGRVLLYALAAIPVGAVCVALSWDGELSRPEGLLLVGLYVAYVAVIWRLERAPPLLGEVEVLNEARAGAGRPGRVGREFLLVFAGLAAMAGGASLLVESVRRLTDVEATQTQLGLTLVGFATAFELVMLVWSAARRGVTEVALAGVVGSFAYNCTMSLGAGALLRPLVVTDARALHLPALAMLGILAAVIGLALPNGVLGWRVGTLLLTSYGVFLALVFVLG